MKKIYLTVLLLVFSVVLLSAQNSTNNYGTQVEDAPSFKLYPNPAFDDVVYITTENNGNKDITIYDVFGEVVLRNRITANALTISKLTPGVYVLQVMENEKAMSRKLVVK